MQGRELCPYLRKTAAIFLITAVLFLYVFCYVFQFAVQSAAQLIQRFGFDVFIGAQTAYCLAVDAAFFSELVRGNILQLHCFPQSVKSNHLYNPHLDDFYYGGYNLFQ